MLRFTSTVVSNAATANSVAASQTPSGAGNLTLTATTVTFGTGSAQKVTATSTSNISNRTLTITGTDIYGNALVEAITGPNNSTVTTNNAFLTVTNVAISGAAAGALTVGNSAYAEGKMFACDDNSNPFSIGFGTAFTSGTPTWTVQHTFDNVLPSATGPRTTGPFSTAYNYQSSSNVWYNHPIVSSWASSSGNIDGNYAFPVSAIRLTLSAAGTVKIQLWQSGGGYR